MFWTKYTAVCKELGKTPTGFAKELHITASTVSSWKKGCIPNIETLLKISDITGKSIDYLVSEDEENISISSKKNTFKSITSLPQRFISLISGSMITEEELIKLSEYLNCSKDYLTSSSEYKPLNEYNINNLYDISTLHNIFKILDRCADTDLYKCVQIQISKIILYWLFQDSTGWTIEKLKSIKELNSAKINFIYSGNSNFDPTLNYGLNYTELTVISEYSKLSYQYLLTGRSDNIFNR